MPYYFWMNKVMNTESEKKKMFAESRPQEKSFVCGTSFLKH